MSLCLTSDEIVELTARTQHAAQLRWLATNGWAHTVDADGRPKVLRAYAEAQLGLSKPPTRGAGAEPDFTVFRRAA